MTNSYLEYKGYHIEPAIVCFDIRYFVFGDGFTYNHYADINKAKQAIDAYICKKYIHNLVNNISKELNVTEDIVLESFKDILLN